MKIKISIYSQYVFLILSLACYPRHFETIQRRKFYKTFVLNLIGTFLSDIKYNCVVLFYLDMTLDYTGDILHRLCAKTNKSSEYLYLVI